MKIPVIIGFYFLICTGRTLYFHAVALIVSASIASSAIANFRINYSLLERILVFGTTRHCELPFLNGVNNYVLCTPSEKLRYSNNSKYCNSLIFRQAFRSS